MEYAEMPNIATSLPHFRESFPSPSFNVPSEYTPSNTFIAPLSASSLQAYNNMNASMMSTKRKVHDFDVPLQDEFETIHDSKRLMLDNPRVGLPISGTRQRQESGCSVSSTSSWSSSASFSTVCSSATVPDLLPSPPSRSVASSRSPSPSESATDGDEYNPLWHICEAIALAEKQNGPLAQVKKTAAAANAKSGSYSTITPFTPRTKRERDDSMCGLKIVFLEPNWLAEHMAKSKRFAALKKQQQQQQQQQQQYQHQYQHQYQQPRY